MVHSWLTCMRASGAGGTPANLKCLRVPCSGGWQCIPPLCGALYSEHLACPFAYNDTHRIHHMCTASCIVPVVLPNRSAGVCTITIAKREQKCESSAASEAFLLQSTGPGS